MSDQIDRFKKRKQLLAELHASPQLQVLPSADEALALLAGDIDQSFIDRSLNTTKLKSTFEVSDEEIHSRLNAISDLIDKEKLDSLFSDARREVIQSIAGPFGIGKLVSILDKEGGNVNTVHNVRNGVYASEQERTAYESREQYNPHDYHAGNEKYNQRQERDNRLIDSGKLSDPTTGRLFDPKHRKHGASPNSQLEKNLDHDIAAIDIANDPGRVLANVNGPDIANIEENLNSIGASINKSKKDMTVEAFLIRLKNEEPARIARIKELETSNNLTAIERKELTKLQELQSVDPKKFRELDKKAREKYNKIINHKYYTSKKFATNLVLTSGIESGKMATQQAIGVLLSELFEALFDETKDWFLNGRANEKMMDELSERFKRIATRVSKKWKDAVDAFKNGAIAGFISNIVTTLVNMFLTTAKNVVRMIREGTASLLKAIKMAVSPPEGVSRKEAMHEALKIILAGTIVVGGVALETTLSKYFEAFPFGDLITSVVVGSITAMATLLAVYLFDKADIFGVNELHKLNMIGSKLDESIAASEARLLTLGF